MFSWFSKCPSCNKTEDSKADISSPKMSSFRKGVLRFSLQSRNWNPQYLDLQARKAQWRAYTLLIGLANSVWKNATNKVEHKIHKYFAPLKYRAAYKLKRTSGFVLLERLRYPGFGVRVRVFFFKMVNNLVIIEPSVPKTRSARPTRWSISTGIPKFVIPRSKTTLTHQHSFQIRTTRVWNSQAGPSWWTETQHDKF